MLRDRAESRERSCLIEERREQREIRSRSSRRFLIGFLPADRSPEDVMWGLAMVRHGLRWGRRRRTARVVDESALGADGDDAAAAPAAAGGAAVVAPTLGGALARALLALACAVRFDGEDGGATEEAWAASGWRPRADEVSHLMVRESMRYAIYA